MSKVYKECFTGITVVTGVYRQNKPVAMKMSTMPKIAGMQATYSIYMYNIIYNASSVMAAVICNSGHCLINTKT